jgi:hypothetical protein
VPWQRTYPATAVGPHEHRGRFEGIAPDCDLAQGVFDRSLRSYLVTNSGANAMKCIRSSAATVPAAVLAFVVLNLASSAPASATINVSG